MIDVQVRLEAQGEVNLEQREQRVGRLRDTDGCQSRVRSGSGRRGIKSSTCRGKEFGLDPGVLGGHLRLVSRCGLEEQARNGLMSSTSRGCCWTAPGWWWRTEGCGSTEWGGGRRGVRVMPVVLTKP